MLGKLGKGFLGTVAAVVGAMALMASPASAAFGITNFETDPVGVGGTPALQAGSHPLSFTTDIGFNTHLDPETGLITPDEDVKDISVELPPGFSGNPQAVPRCTASEIGRGGETFEPPNCPLASQVGIITIYFNGAPEFTVPLWNMVPGPGVPASFGFNIAGVVVRLQARVRTGSDYGVTVEVPYVPEGIPLGRSVVTMWGVPGAGVHNAQRGQAFVCHGEPSNPANCENGGHEAGIPPKPFLREPTSCTAPGVGVQSLLHTDSWMNPGSYGPGHVPNLADPSWKSASYTWHDETEPSVPAGPSGCEALPFSPTVSLVPSTNAAESPTGLDVDVHLPQNENPEGLSSSDLRNVTVTLPEGMTVNPSSVTNLGACSPAEIELNGPEPASCPDTAKIGAVEIKTPLLEQPLKGAVYLAQQGSNPFKSLLAIYIAVADPQTGVVLKLAGKVEPDPKTGQLRTTFENNPQLPFEDLRVSFFSGPRASLMTPPSCGSYTAQASFTPWSGAAPVPSSSSFQISQGPHGGPCPTGGFDPKLSAGVESPVAGISSPFNLRLSREDGSQRFTALDVTPPAGLTAKLAGVPYCPDSALASFPSPAVAGTGAAELANPKCPAASRIGTATVGAGAGANPFYLSTGRVYLAGPYKGAPLSLAIVTPAVAGPFDLGSVLVRSAVQVNPETAQISVVSDPIPTILEGIPLDLRDIRVAIDRAGFMQSPTSCDPASVAAAVSGTGGASASLSDRFQVGNCGQLGFKPKLSLRLSGGTKRNQNPRFRATLTMPPGGANIARAQVALPHSEFLDNAHIRTVCTRVQFAADQCPPASVYGFARAVTPLLEKPLEGPVYLRSSNNPLPDLVADLNGQIHIVLDGRIDSVRGGIRNTFELVPDAPVSKFTLEMQGGKRGLLVNSADLCAHVNRATVQFEGHNGKVASSRPVLANSCGQARKRKGR